jgi:glycosyltransferase involved in cell wall biosynthesis
VSVARNGVDHVRFHAAATHIDAPWLRAVLVGRLIANKGTLLALDALSIARKSGRDVRLTIVGDGPMRGEVMSRIASPDLAGAVEMTGRVDNVEHWLRTADVSLRPSFTEGLPLAVLESLACGVPVVCSHSPGKLELVKHENNGLVIPIGDADALAKALIRLCDDRAILRAMSLAANVSVSHFTWEATARAHMDAFEKAAPCGWTVAP